MSRVSSLFFSLSTTLQKHSTFLLGVFVVFAGLTFSFSLKILQDQQLRVVFMNVGQGDAIWIHAPNGRDMVIDSGSGQAVLSELGKQKSFFDRTIDMVLATHSDKDHIGGFPALFDRYVIHTVIESEISSPTLTDKMFQQKIKDESAKNITARTGERIVLDHRRGIVVDILFPDQNSTGWETNEASVIAKVSYGTTSFLLTGDAPSEVEEHLVRLYGDQLRADVLKLGHHGSKTSSSEIFLETVDPDIAIVSSGLGNKYGHPADEVVERVEQTGAQILRTDELGSIDCRSNGFQVECVAVK